MNHGPTLAGSAPGTFGWVSTLDGQADSFARSIPPTWSVMGFRKFISTAILPAI